MQICFPLFKNCHQELSVNRTSSKSSSDNIEMLTSGMLKIHKRTSEMSFILSSLVIFLMPVMHIIDEQITKKDLDAKETARMAQIWNSPESTEGQ